MLRAEQVKEGVSVEPNRVWRFNDLTRFELTFPDVNKSPVRLVLSYPIGPGFYFLCPDLPVVDYRAIPFNIFS